MMEGSYLIEKGASKDYYRMLGKYKKTSISQDLT